LTGAFKKKANFILPGLFLIGAMGVAPLFIAFGLWKCLPWTWPRSLAQKHHAHPVDQPANPALGSSERIQIFYPAWGMVMIALGLWAQARKD
jgi:hypothetical protein